MATKLPFKTTFEAEKAIQPVFTGGSVGVDNGARVLATTLGEDAVLTDLTTGRRLAIIEGVCSPPPRSWKKSNSDLHRMERLSPR